MLRLSVQKSLTGRSNQPPIHCPCITVSTNWYSRGMSCRYLDLSSLAVHKTWKKCSLRVSQDKSYFSLQVLVTSDMTTCRMVDIATFWESDIRTERLDTSWILRTQQPQNVADYLAVDSGSNSRWPGYWPVSMKQAQILRVIFGFKPREFYTHTDSLYNLYIFVLVWKWNFTNRRMCPE